VNLKNKGFRDIFAIFFAAHTSKVNSTKWLQIDQDSLLTGTAIGCYRLSACRASREHSLKLLFLSLFVPLIIICNVFLQA